MSEATRKRSSSKRRTGNSNTSTASVLHGVQFSTFRHLLIAVCIVYVGLPIVFHLLPQAQPWLSDDTLFSSTVDAESTAASTSPSSRTTPGPFAAAHPSNNPKSPLVRLLQDSGFTLVTPFKFLWLSSTYLVTSIIRIAHFAFSYILYSIQLFTYSASFVLHPFRFILDPLTLAARILLAPIVVPLYGLYRLLTAFYPVYVFLAATCICGVVVGWTAKWASVIATNGVLAIMES